MIKKLFILTLFSLLSSCAHKTVQIKAEEKAKVPTDTVEFSDPRVNNLEADDSTAPSSPACSDDKILFLIRAPFESMQLLKEFYERMLILNIDQHKLLEASVALRVGSISPENFVSLVDEITFRAQKLTEDQEKNLVYSRQLDLYTNVHYIQCQEEFKEILTSKSLDPKGNSCEFSQQQAYIIDPFQLKMLLKEGIFTELSINDQIRELQSIVNDEAEGKTTSEEAKALFTKKAKEFDESGLGSHSEEIMEKIYQSYEATMTIKDKCLEANKK